MEEQKVSDWRSYCVTLGLLVLNIVGYIFCTQMGEVVYTIGSMNAEKILVAHEYYRFLTSVFLHADIEHLVSNMIFLFGLGQMVEQVTGHISFSIVYLLSGFGGSIFSILYAVLTGKIYDAVGASGAIFGLVGALFILVVARDLKRRSHSQGTVEILDQRGRQMPGAYESVSVGRIIFAVVYMIYSGSRAAGVDNAAHVGGLLCGIMIMAVINIVNTGGYKR
ncbi:MAG: rhomboid family intramembrane serine protease [Lachnospiraceae bacterium]|nr:rhomboid family intramembrane serine protease [Lachnospiraceae bacterium]MCI8973951.1 rhomboid family intramembrane serine protease [Lachnospiraceae bacterium]